LSDSTLRSHRKSTNRAGRYRDLVKKIHDRGIGIEGSFIFGSDEDEPSVFEDVGRFCEDARIDAAVFAILTPFPGTRVYDRYSREGRITSQDWDLYDMDHVVFRPAKMTARELQEGHDRINREF
ncbi:MAG TPA: radical SAM protein, partial [Thermodesulfobacteriota bacterium]|nr:radical SAM protein [Thermodesulfobacteriota bacterium]